MPPVSADMRTTAIIGTVGPGAADIALTGIVRLCYGVAIQAGSGTSAASINITGNGLWKFKNGGLILNNTSASSAVVIGSDSSSANLILDNTPITFGAVGQDISIVAGRFTWQNTASAILGSVPNTLFADGGSRSFAPVLIEGVDLSAATSGKNLVAAQSKSGTFTFKDCTFGAGVTVAVAPTLAIGGEVFVVNSDSSGTNYRHEKYDYPGSHIVDTALYRTGGASNGTTPLSWKIAATANAKWAMTFDTIRRAVWNDTTATNRTLTMEGLQDPRTSTSLPTNEDIWMELSYMGSASSPIATVNSGTKADILAAGSNLTASTEAWDAGVTARANTTAYVLGDRIKVASNPGRVFICTTAGTSNGTEPAGYASAVDGGAVTDNTATFTAAVRFQQSITLSSPQPAQKGPIYAQFKVGKASGIYYIDPKPVLS